MLERPRTSLPSTSDARAALHVVHVVSSLEIGGQERVVLDLARALFARGHRVTILSLAHGGSLRPAFGPIPVLTVARRKGFDPVAPVKIAAMLRSLAPDVVHTHNPAALTYAGPAARTIPGVRLVHTKHGANPAPRFRNRIARKLLARICDSYVAVSEPTADVARAVERIAEPLLQIIPNGIDVSVYVRRAEERKRIRTELGIDEGSCLVGTVGRLAPEKNHALLVSAIAPLLGPKVHLAIVGDGPERPQIERAIAARNRPFVHLMGTRFDIPAILSALDLFVLSSSTEGLPLVVPEAMACGLPVVSTRVGGLPGVVSDGVSGTLVPPNDAPALGEAIAALVAEPERRRRYAEAARRDAVVRFSLDRVVDAYEALYARRSAGTVVQGRRSSSPPAPRPDLGVPLPPECVAASRS